MFDKNFNIISGNRESGRTRFILNLSKYLDGLGIKLFFLGCVDEFPYPKTFLSQFRDYRIIDSSDYNNLRTIEMVKEITERYEYHFLIVDDIDYLSPDCINLLSKINVRKIVTCLNTNSNKIKDIDSDVFNIEELTSDVNIIKSMVREQKINFLLND